MKTSKKILALLLSAIMIFALTACGGGKKESTEAPPSGGGYEETVYSAYQADLSTPDPYGSTEAVVAFFTNLTFRTVTFNNPDTGKLEGILAESWKDVNGDGKVWDVTLKKGIKFHNGEELTAEDIKFTWEYAGAGSGKTTKTIAVYSSCEKIECPDTYTVRFTLKVPMFDFPTYLDQKVYCKKAFDTMDAAKAAAIGCGPYYFDESLTTSGVQFGCTRFDDFYLGMDKYPTKHFVFKVVGDYSTQVAKLQAGEIDFLFNLTVTNYQILEADPNITGHSRAGANSYFMGFNYRKEIWYNADLRKALAMAINKQDIIDGNFNGIGGIVSNNFCAPSGAGYIEITDPVKYDPDAAKAWLQANGFGDLKIKIASNVTQKTNCEIIQAALKAVGVTVEIQEVESTSWAETLKTGDYDIFCNYCAYQGALLYNFQRFLYTGGSSNTFSHSEEEFDKLYDEAANASSYEEMVSKFQVLEKWVAEKQTLVPLAIANFFAASRKDVQGISLAPTTNWQDFSTVYIPSRK